MPIQKTPAVKVIDMQFNFVLIAFVSHGEAPLTSVLKSTGKGCRFAPLSDDGLIYTADVSLWSKRNGVIDEREEVFCPRNSTITQAMTIADRDNCHFVMALTCLEDFDPPESPNVHLRLVSVSQILEKFSAIDLTEVGFDIIDQWTGLSALANVGYGVDDCVKLKNMQLTVNDFGLFISIEDAESFARFALAVAPEHAPFIPVRVLVRFPKNNPLSVNDMGEMAVTNGVRNS